MKDLKSNSTSDFFGPCYLGIKGKDQTCMLIGLNGVCCKKNSIPIYQKCSISSGSVIRDQINCCYDSYLGEKMIGDGYPYKFVTFFENEEYFYFLQVDDTIKEMLVDFLQIIVGAKFPSSQDYGFKIIYTGKIQPQETIIKDVFQI